MDAPPDTTDAGLPAPCTSDADCDITGEGLYHCSNKLYILSPLNPTAICIGIDFGGGDLCDAGTPFKPSLCKDPAYLCTTTDANPALCQALCTLDETGKMTRPCVGKNACNPYRVGPDGAGKNAVFGYCLGGCVIDADCPSGSVCDRAWNFCVEKVCTTDTECTKLFPKGAPGFACLAAGADGKRHCGFAYAKSDGEACTPVSTGLADCACLGRPGPVGSGVCATACRTVDYGATNPECGAGFVCDPLVPPKDASGMDTFGSAFHAPAGLAGRCLRTCKSDAECGAVRCTQSPGVPTMTCKPTL